MTTSLSRLQELLPQLFQTHQLPGDVYLRLQLTAEITALLSVEQVKESILTNAEQITPLPNLSDAVIGMMSSRNQVFCVIDLAQMLGFPSVTIAARRYHVIVLRLSPTLTESSPESESLLGIAVDRILGIARLTSDKLQSPMADFPASLTPYLRGCLLDGERQAFVLDLRSIGSTLTQLV